ncbi:MAG TPA: secondary thiamine-phosphate synthase enzyme YjbQ [bacterium]|nr:secondary thiamine-phosphate synthase enzyme YjbQ [bacterium]
MVYSTTLEISTSAAEQAVDITSRVGGLVRESGIANGLVLVFTTHTTTGLFLNEHEGGLEKDVQGVLARLVPPRAGYLHDRVDDNAASHIQSVLLGPSLVLPVTDGRLDLGRWQNIFLAERDGPRRRTVVVKVMGERS